MLRRTTPKHAALPLLKLMFLATKQITKPMAKLVVASATEVPIIDRMCIAVGRFVLGSTGALREEAEKQRQKAEEAARAKLREADLIAHVKIDIEEGLRVEMDELKRLVASYQTALEEERNAAGGSSSNNGSGGIMNNGPNNASSAASGATPTTSSATSSDAPSASSPDAAPTCPTILFSTPACTKPALPKHKQLFGLDNSPPVFPPEPRIEVEPFTIPVTSIVVPLGGGATAAPESSATAAPTLTPIVVDEGSPADVLAKAEKKEGEVLTAAAGMGFGQQPQFATPSLSQQSDGINANIGSAASGGFATSAAPLPSDKYEPFRISAVPNMTTESPSLTMLNHSNNVADVCGNDGSKCNIMHGDAQKAAAEVAKEHAAAVGGGHTVSGGAAAVVKKTALGGSSSSSSSSAADGEGKTTSSSSGKSSTTAGAAPTIGGGAKGGRFTFHKSINAAVQNRFYAKVSDDTLRKAGAELFVEVIVLTVLSIMLTYEYIMSKRFEAKREEQQLARLRALEEKVNELAAKHAGSIAAVTVGAGHLQRQSRFGSLLGVFGGWGGRHNGIDDESQTDGDPNANPIGRTASDEPDDAHLDMHQRMMNRGLSM